MPLVGVVQVGVVYDIIRYAAGIESTTAWQTSWCGVKVQAVVLPRVTVGSGSRLRRTGQCWAFMSTRCML